MTGYLYILKHGIGPGTIPNDVTILKEKDLPNYYTAVWLDRFLTTSEMDRYDIPYETEINDLLSWIDYCQTEDGNDVVPCDSIKACGDVMASTASWKVTDYDDNDEPRMYSKNLGDKGYICIENYGGNGSKNEWHISLESYDNNNIGELSDYFRDLDRAKSYAEEYVDDKVNACGNVMASYDYQTFDELSNYYSSMDTMSLGDIWDEVNNRYNDEALANDVVSEVEAIRAGEDEDIWGAVDVTKPKYFANMVSADTYFRHPDEWGYEVRGYYDEDRRGLAESDWTEDIRMVNDLLNEYANKGYNLRIVNCYAGIIVDIDTDDWFDNFYPEGISEGELE